MITMSSYAHPEALASTQWVADHLNDPPARLIEVIGGTSLSRGIAVYESEHIARADGLDRQCVRRAHQDRRGRYLEEGAAGARRARALRCGGFELVPSGGVG